MIQTSSRQSRMRAVDRRQLILQAGRSVFSRKGYGGTTTKEIAAAAGVTEAIIFRHFPTKQALYRAVLDLRAQTPGFKTWLDSIRSHMERNDDSAVFRALVSGVLRAYRDDLEYERLLLFAALEGHEAGLAHHREFSLAIFEELRDYLARRQGEGAMRNYDPGLIVTALAGTAEFYATRTQMFGFDAGNLPDEEVVETFTQMILNGIRPSPNGNESRDRE